MFQISIDRIFVVVPLATKYDKGALSASLWASQGEPGCKVWSNNHCTFAKIALNGTQTLRVTVGTSHKVPYGKFDFAPASLDAESWELLGVNLSYMLEYGYKSLLHQGRVSYLEIAVDCKCVEWPGLLPFDSKTRNSRWEPSFLDPHPTAYLGRRGSERVIRVYDRVERLKQKGISIEGPVTRVEASLRKLKCKIADLDKIKNPFLTVGVCTLADADAAFTMPSWHKFMERCKKHGTSIALSQSGLLRKPWLQKLQSLNCDWWNPHTIWDAYPSALASLKTPAAVTP